MLNIIAKLYFYSFKNIWKKQTLDIYEIKILQGNNRLDNWVTRIILECDNVTSRQLVNHMKWCLPFNICYRFVIVGIWYLYFRHKWNDCNIHFVVVSIFVIQTQKVIVKQQLYGNTCF